MASTIQVEVMYNDTDRDTGTYRRKRVSLDAAHTLDREDVWYIILSDEASSIINKANARRTIGEIYVDRLDMVQWDDSDTGVAFLLRRRGEVCLAVWEDTEWIWHPEEDPFTTRTPFSGISPDLPNDALIFHLVDSSISVARSDLATAVFDADMF